MATDKIFFDEQALSVVDSWLGGSSVKVNKSSAASSNSAAAPLSKVGLGFRGKVTEEKPKDALQIRLDKSQKKKKDDKADDESNKRKVDMDDNDNDDNDDDDDLQLHGIVEDMPISRTQQFSKSSKNIPSQPKKKVKAATEISNHKGGNDSIEVPSSASGSVSNFAADSSSSKTTSIEINNNNNNNNNKAAPTGTTSATTANGGDDYKRKRTKTRSKQKNIRRDNRPDSQKPSYITNTEAEDYRGRELTEVNRMNHNLVNYLCIDYFVYASNVLSIHTFISSFIF